MLAVAERQTRAGPPSPPDFQCWLWKGYAILDTLTPYRGLIQYGTGLDLDLPV